MLNLVRRVPALVYDLFISAFLTVAAHLVIVNYMHLSSGNFLDIGCGTGKPLKAIVAGIKRFHQKIVGVDITPEYAEECIRAFNDDPQV